jgi:hypothetical protein
LVRAVRGGGGGIRLTGNSHLKSDAPQQTAERSCCLTAKIVESINQIFSVSLGSPGPKEVKAPFPKETNNQSEKPTIDWFVRFLELRLTDVLIIFFTGLLAIRTSGLYRETAALRTIADQQRADLLLSIEAAQDSARAAELSAKAAIGVELPMLSVSKIEFQPATPYLETSFDTVVVTITNYGRTPAFLFWETCEFRIGATLFDEPEYKNGVDLDPGTIIESQRYRTITARGVDMRSQFLKRPFVDGEQTIWVYGFIWFRDFLSNEKSFRFCAEYAASIFPGGGRRGRFIQHGPPKYVQNPRQERG